MFGYGAILGVGYALGLDVKIIGAKEWQKSLLDLKPYSVDDKEASKKASVASVKEWNKDLDLRKTKRSKKDDHNLADSICIARYAHLKFGPQE